MEKRLFTSECVTCGHPDKVADRIAGALVDLAYKKDNTQIALNALEIIGFGAVNLYLSYTIELYAMKLGLENITNVILYVGGAILIYYILKCIVIAVKNIKKFKKENNDIKEIIKK